MAVQYDVRPDLAALKAQVDPVHKRQLPFAISLALNRTIWNHVIPGERREMERVFDRPTRFTLNSLRRDKVATKDKLEASAGFIGDYGRGGKDHYLWPQIEGGPRVEKRFEAMLRKWAWLKPGWRAVPGSAARLDANGNMSPGQIVQIMSQLRLQEFDGFESRIGGKNWDRKKVEKSIRRQGYAIFGVREKKGRLLPGVYARYQFAFGSAVKPLLIFVPNAVYRQRFDFYQVGEKISRQEFPGEFEKAMAYAMKTAVIDITAPL